MEEYRVLYKPYAGNYMLSEIMSLEQAREFKDKLLKMNYQEEYIHIIMFVE